VKVTTAVPAETPVTTPVDTATDTLPEAELQVPAPVASDKEVVLPAQTVSVPDIAAGSGLTVTDAVPVDVHPELVYVAEYVVAPAEEAFIYTVEAEPPV